MREPGQSGNSTTHDADWCECPATSRRHFRREDCPQPGRKPAEKCERCGRFASTVAAAYGPVSQGSEPSPYYWCAPCREVATG